MPIIKYIKQKLFVPKEYQKEFALLNKASNNRAVFCFSVAVTVLFGAALLIGHVSMLNEADGVEKFELIKNCYIAIMAVSIIAAIVLEYLWKKGRSQHWLSDLTSMVYICTFLVIILISTHLEIQATGIKNISVLIVAMFAIVFCSNFGFPVTVSVETAFTLSLFVMLLTEKKDITNFYSSLINLIAAYTVVMIAACIYWNLRVDSFVRSKNLEELVTSDALTEIHNRRGFDFFFERAWEKAVEEGSSLALFIADIDFFKEYNDIHGHVEGDKCLIAVADVISKCVRETDFVARYGGEEFAVVLPRTGIEAAKKIANRMFERIKNKNILHGRSVEPYVTFSIGCMTCCPASTEIMREGFVELADEALYMAKREGRNRFVIHPDAEEEMTCFEAAGI